MLINEKEYNEICINLETLLDNDPENDEKILELALLIEEYEKVHYPID